MKIALFILLILFVESAVGQDIKGGNVFILDTIHSKDLKVYTDNGTRKKPDKVSWIDTSNITQTIRRKNIWKQNSESFFFSLSTNEYMTLLLFEKKKFNNYPEEYISLNALSNQDPFYDCTQHKLSRNQQRLDFKSTDFVYCIINGKYLNEYINKNFQKNVWYSCLVPLPSKQ